MVCFGLLGTFMHCRGLPRPAEVCLGLMGLLRSARVSFGLQGTAGLSRSLLGPADVCWGLLGFAEVF